MAKILKCKKCSTYTLKKKCHNCGAETVNPEPAKFSPEDKYGKYRRLYKKQLLSEA
ncbi:TPA: RNA-protein complex protein Nop10 [archaeon]|uniref:Ribosome biogenesis protein Nop10 n=1 Tax=Candidatus Naiadarchaeum limnaeum TaxID=2756139 RepID=A0A832XJ13_9ARCH|nr:RNA-protein complex protein Nop10 [Candidatus Naiadarchaeales archaeon SRR2090153.bin1042]HIJ99961.1 RNA-protein complex protein Nop10 [Candidatus Naiadarchaeum limnaeum]